MRVELDVYSGRPNPRWELTDQQAAELLKRLEAAQPVPGDSTSFDGLGYRGFVVKAEGGGMGGFEEIRVFQGKVVGIRKSGTVVFQDPQHSVEAWLLESGRSHIEQATMEYVGKEIDAR